MKKKLFSLLLAGAMIVTAACSGGKAPAGETNTPDESATAETNAEDEASDDTAKDEDEAEDEDDMDYPEVGMKFVLSEPFLNLKGRFLCSPSDSMAKDGLYYASFIYVALSEDDYKALEEKDDLTDEEMQEYFKKSYSLGRVWGVEDGDTPEKALEILFTQVEEEDLEKAKERYTPESLTKLGQAENVTFYFMEKEEEDAGDDLEGDFKTEYETLEAAMPDFASKGEFSVPVKRYADLIGKKLSFETKDLDGNTIKSEELFAQHEITMLNVWATWCTWCVKELPELEKINKRLEDKNCAIVGVLGDAEEKGKTEEGKKLLAENGDTYLNIVPWEGFEDEIEMEGWPTSFFVDSEGRIVGDPVVGADTEGYESEIDDILEGNTGVDTEDKKEEKANGEDAYRIIVADEAAAPVKGVTVQFCSEDACFMKKTDEEGVASFDNEPGVYTIHILAVPEGYKKDPTEYKTAETYSDTQIVLEKE